MPDATHHDPTHEDHRQRGPIEIQTPCPKTWVGLAGDQHKRFCAQCDLHVHNAAELTREEAVELATGSDERVCMRIVHDERGAPIFRDSSPALRAGSRSDTRIGIRFGSRLARWSSSCAAGLLALLHAACQPGAAATSGNQAAAQTGAGAGDPETSCSTELLGSVAVRPPELLGEVALPAQGEPSDPGAQSCLEPLETLGRAAVLPEPDEQPD